MIEENKIYHCDKQGNKTNETCNMKTNTVIVILILVVIAALILFIRQNNQLYNELTAIKSQRNVELLTAIDSVKSAEFAIYEAELKKQDSIYNAQIILLQNENKNLKTRYNRLYSDYADIVIDRPRW